MRTAQGRAEGSSIGGRGVVEAVEIKFADWNAPISRLHETIIFKFKLCMGRFEVHDKVMVKHLLKITENLSLFGRLSFTMIEENFGKSHFEIL